VKFALGPERLCNKEEKKVLQKEERGEPSGAVLSFWSGEGEKGGKKEGIPYKRSLHGSRIIIPLMNYFYKRLRWRKGGGRKKSS